MTLCWLESVATKCEYSIHNFYLNLCYFNLNRPSYNMLIRWFRTEALGFWHFPSFSYPWIESLVCCISLCICVCVGKNIFANSFPMTSMEVAATVTNIMTTQVMVRVEKSRCPISSNQLICVEKKEVESNQYINHRKTNVANSTQKILSHKLEISLQ